jgi:hypothetical protein
MSRPKASRELGHSLDVNTMHACLYSKADLPKRALMDTGEQDFV